MVNIDLLVGGKLCMCVSPNSLKTNIIEEDLRGKFRGEREGFLLLESLDVNSLLLANG